MPAAFNRDVQETDQTQGAHPSHSAKGSRFGPEDVRGPVVLGANVQEAVAEYKRGTFTIDDLKQLAFAMGCQIVEGKNTVALAGEVVDLKAKLANALHRAEMAEGAYQGKNEISDESFAAMAAKAGFIPKSELDAMTTRATTAETALAAGDAPKPAEQ